MYMLSAMKRFNFIISLSAFVANRWRYPVMKHNEIILLVYYKKKISAEQYYSNIIHNKNLKYIAILFYIGEISSKTACCCIIIEIFFFRKSRYFWQCWQKIQYLTMLTRSFPLFCKNFLSSFLSLQLRQKHIYPKKIERNLWTKRYLDSLTIINTLF